MIRIVSFGFKHRRPPEGYLMFDCRSLPNPHHVPALKAKTGLDKKVAEYVSVGDGLYALTAEAVIAASEGTTKLAFGCVGGRHRSVAVAEAAAQVLRENRYKVDLEHLEL